MKGKDISRYVRCVLAVSICILSVGVLSSVRGDSPTIDEISPQGVSSDKLYTAMSGTKEFNFDAHDADGDLAYLELDIYGPVPYDYPSCVQFVFAANEADPYYGLDGMEWPELLKIVAADMGISVVYDDAEQKWILTVDTNETWSTADNPMHPYFGLVSNGDPVWPGSEYSWQICLHDDLDNTWGDNSNPYVPGAIGTARDYTYIYYFHNIESNLENVLYLEPTDASIYIKPTEDLIVDMDVANLQQMINTVDAMLGYSSTYFSDPTGGAVQPGSGPFDVVLYDTWEVGNGIPGEIDTYVGISASGPVGVDWDCNVAQITLAANGTEGITRMFFRPDDPQFETKRTAFFDIATFDWIYPMKIDSTDIYIDGTAPLIDNLTAMQDQDGDIIAETNVLNCALPAFLGTVILSVDAEDAVSDGMCGLAGEPEVTVTKGMDSLLVTYINEHPEGTFNYAVAIDSSTINGSWNITATATDKADNFTVTTGTICICKRAVIVNIAWSISGNPEIEWTSESDTTYRMEVADSANGYDPPNLVWTTKASGIPGNAGTTIWEDNETPPEVSRFYRVCPDGSTE